MRRAIFALALLAACKSPAPPSSFGINVIVDANALSSGARAQITSAALSVSGDETYSRTFDIRAAIASGQVRFRYIPGITSGSITLALDALSSDGSIVARAPATTVMVATGQAVATTLVLAAAAADDMGSSGDAGDGGTCDPGFHACGGSCADDRSVDTCGTSCSPCPVTANATAATCDGTSCGVQCNSGYHVCAGACVSATSANSCNMSCTPCTPPTGGTATCDGTSCSGACPSGQKLCFGACIADSMACNGSCPSGTHECSGNCFDDTSVNSCGVSCVPCPVPANATMATCSGGACAFVCNNGYKICGSACIPSTACCTTADCAQPSNGVATCDTSTNTCVIACNSMYTKCGTECISTTACCKNTDCPQPTNGVGACGADHTCSATCNAPYNTVCGTACVDTTSDNNNCGACNVHCAGQCMLSRCVVTLATAQNSPERLAVDATSVYWTNYGDIMGTNGTVIKIPIDGGTATTLASNQAAATSLAIDDSFVYWTGSAAVNKVAKSGGGSTALVSTQYNLAGIATDGTNVYFCNSAPNATSTGTIAQVATTGGTVTNLASPKNCGEVAVYSSNVYWSDVANGGILKTPIGGGTSVQIAPDGIYFISLDGSHICGTTGGGTDAGILCIPMVGGTATTLASGEHYTMGVVVSGSDVYWGTEEGVMKVSVNGGTPTMIAAAPSMGKIEAVAVDANSVYWIAWPSLYGSFNDGLVMKATPR